MKKLSWHDLKKYTHKLFKGNNCLLWYPGAPKFFLQKTKPEIYFGIASRNCFEIENLIKDG